MFSFSLPEDLRRGGILVEIRCDSFSRVWTSTFSITFIGQHGPAICRLGNAVKFY
jgi:hypothetical protein